MAGAATWEPENLGPNVLKSISFTYSFIIDWWWIKTWKDACSLVLKQISILSEIELIWGSEVARVDSRVLF